MMNGGLLSHLNKWNYTPTKLMLWGFAKGKKLKNKEKSHKSIIKFKLKEIFIGVIKSYNAINKYKEKNMSVEIGWKKPNEKTIFLCAITGKYGSTRVKVREKWKWNIFKD